MKRIAGLVIMVTLLGGVALQPSALGTGTGRPEPVSWYAVESGSPSGSGYSLTSLSWQVTGTASGGGYRLLAPEAPALGGSGCCCTYLPLILRNAP